MIRSRPPFYIELKPISTVINALNTNKAENFVQFRAVTLLLSFLAVQSKKAITTNIMVILACHFSTSKNCVLNPTNAKHTQAKIRRKKKKAISVPCKSCDKKPQGGEVQH